MARLLLILLCAMMFSFQAQAQRLIPGQKGVELTGGVLLVKGERLFHADSYTASLSLTRYMKRTNYAFGILSLENQNIPYKDFQVPMTDALLEIGYMEPLIGDRGRNVISYIGLSAAGGYEWLNNDKKVLPDGAMLLDGSCFVYGGGVHLSVECFLTDNIVLVVRTQGRMLFGTDVHHFRPALTAGLRFNL